MGQHETITERILAEAHARPQVSIALMDTLLPAGRADIQAAFNHLVASGELVAVGTPGLYRLREARPDPHTLLTLLAAQPRTLDELVKGVRWKEELIREAVRVLILEGLVGSGEGAVLSCTLAGLSRCGWAEDVRRAERPERPGSHRMPPLERPNEGNTRRDRLADTFAPIVLTWALHNAPEAVLVDITGHVAQRAYELADALVAAGRQRP